MIPIPCTFGFALGKRLEIRRSIDEVAFDDHLEISNAISDVLSPAEEESNHQLDTFLKFFDDPVLSRFCSNEGFDFARYLESVHVARTARYEGGVEPVLGSLHLPGNRKLLLEWLNTWTKSEETSDQTEPLNAFWLAPATRFWARSIKVRPLADDVNRLLRRKRADESTEGSEDEEY